MFNEIYLAIKQATKIDDLKKNIVLNIDKRKEDNPLITVAAQLAKDGEIVKLDWLRRLGADVHVIAQGYAIAANHEQVEIYRTKFNADVDIIAHGYAIAGNHKYVQIYHKKYKANIDLIAVGYAIAGNLELVEICRTQYKADIDLIAYGYALSENHNQVEVYFTSHGASAYFIAQGYALVGNDKQNSKYHLHNLLDNYLRNRVSIKDSFGKTKDYHWNSISFFTIFQKSSTQKMDAVHALKQALNGGTVCLTQYLSTLNNGLLGKEINKYIKSGLANSLLGIRINTISEFVRTLDTYNGVLSNTRGSVLDRCAPR